MKIIKSGSVQITDDDLNIYSFDFDCEGGPMLLGAAAICVIDWIEQRCAEQREKIMQGEIVEFDDEIILTDMAQGGGHG